MIAMQGILYEENSLLVFVFVTLILGGAGAWMTGRACASTWRPYPPLLVYLLILSLAVRFIHFALFAGTLVSLHYWLIDAVFVLVVGTVAYRYTRANQMISQYYWLYTKSGPFAWRPK
jgi:small-conductance mechanosensitive channel